MLDTLTANGYTTPAVNSSLTKLPSPRSSLHSITYTSRGDQYTTHKKIRFKIFKWSLPPPRSPMPTPTIFPITTIGSSIAARKSDPSRICDHRNSPKNHFSFKVELHLNHATKNHHTNFKNHGLVQGFGLCSWIYELRCLNFCLYCVAQLFLVSRVI